MKKWTVILPATLLALMVMGGAAFAQAAGGNGTPAAATGFLGLLKGLGCGAVVGFIISYLGFLDKRAQDPASPNYNFEKSAGTIIWGAVLGAAFGWTNVDLTKWSDFKDTGATVLIGQLLGKLGLNVGSRAVGRAVGKFRAHAAVPPKTT